MKFQHVILMTGLFGLGSVLAGQKDTLTLIGVGDIMMGTDYPSRVYLPPGDDCRPLLEEVAPVLRNADVTFGNLEGTFAGDSGEAKDCLDTTKCFVFRMPSHYVHCLVDAGFDLLSIANNHSNDFGSGGRMETERVLRENGLAFAGSLSTPFTVIEREGVRFGLLAFAPNKGCYSLVDPQLGAAMVRQLRPECDVLIVSVHGGAEGADHQHMTRNTEVYLGQDRGNIYEFAHTVIDAGADVVLGHGPHVTRAAEVYRDRFIIYSLGNFCTYRRFNLRGPNGMAPIVKLSLAGDGRFLGGKVIPVYQPGEGGPRPDPRLGAIGKLRELTAADFPEVPLGIAPDGRMTWVPGPAARKTVSGAPGGGLEAIRPLEGRVEPVAAAGKARVEEVVHDSIPERPFVPDSLMQPDSTAVFTWPSDSAPDYRVIAGTFLGNERRNYYGNIAPDTLGVIWKYYLGEGVTVISRKLGSRTWAGAGWTGQPLLFEEDGVLYLLQGAYDHTLKKIRASDGKLIWEYAFDDVVKGTGSLWENPDAENPEERLIVLQGSRLGVGNYLDTKHIPSYRAISCLSGKELWRLDVKWTDSYSRDVDGSALILGDTAYLGLENSLFTVFSPDPARAALKDSMLQPEIIRERKLYTRADVSAHKNNVVTESSPSLLGNRIYVTSGSGHVWGYNLRKRELDWDYYIGSDMDGSAVVTSDSCLLVPVEKQYIEGPGGVMKLDPSKSPGEAVVWYQPVADSSFSGWDGGVIGSAGMTDAYFPGNSRQFAAFVGIDGVLRVVEHTAVDSSRRVAGPSGDSLFHPPKGVFEQRVGPSISTPAFAGDKLIVAGYHGLRLYEFDESGNFTLLGKMSPPFESTPVVHEGRIYIASRNGYLYCLGRK